MSDFKILMLVGPSGSGKSTLASKLKPYGIPEIISTTTRPPRPGEVSGTHYHFISDNQFTYLKKKNAFIESATYGEYKYGIQHYSLYTAIMDSPIHTVAVVSEINGYLAIRKLYPKAVRGIFVDCSRHTAALRLRFRKDLSISQCDRRINQYKEDILHRSLFEDQSVCKNFIFDNEDADLDMDISSHLKEWLL